MKALVLRAPGINCDRETALACHLAGFETDLVHINQLVKDGNLLDYDFLIIPGGFSYGDDLGAGTLLAKKLMIQQGEQLRQFIDEGRPVLGICNGFQVLVRAGLLPNFLPGPDEPSQPICSLTDNALAQFECRWVTLTPQHSPCIFTQGIEQPIELPVAHGEGQFVLANPALLAQLQASGQVPLTYYGAGDIPYPHNPNGSIGNIAGICNRRGNVFGLMPHPERYVSALQHPQRRGTDGQGDGDGLLIFKNAYTYARTLAFTSFSYATSGVNIAVADQAKVLMKEAVRATHGPEVLAGMGAFAGVFDASCIKQMHNPALVASTDGVGTKTLLAAQAGRFDTIGYDLVNHCVDDLLTQGARPLFFMDYIAMGKLDPIQAATIVRSVAVACSGIGCALLGGETAEMPDVYLPGAFDLAGTIIGIVERDTLADSSAICVSDVLLGFPSSGPHTNGYSLARRIFAPYPLETVFPELSEPLVDALLRPHRNYLHEIQALNGQADIAIKGIAHITGGGFEGNIGRILPNGVQAVVETSAWSVPPLFQLMARLGSVSREEMYRTFNMGIGMVLVFSPEDAMRAQEVLPELLTVGYIAEGKGVVVQ